MEFDWSSLGRAALFMGGGFVLMVTYFQWNWARTCKKFIRVLVAQKGGGGAFQLAKKDGGEITIENKETETSRTWPVNELATIDVLYPGVGFVPEFLQKTIRMAIVNEGDWEPMLNRSPHKERIASPDVVAFLMELATEDRHKLGVETKKYIKKMAESLCTGPTREMIADPATLGALRKSSVLKALATVSNDLMEEIKALKIKLARVTGANPIVVYIGLGLAVTLSAVNIYMTMQGGDALLLERMGVIERALGIVAEVTP